MSGGIDWRTLPLLACLSCGLSWVRQPPSAQALDRYYRTEYGGTRGKRREAPSPTEYYADERLQHRPDRARRHVETLQRVAGRDSFACALDVGCGFGEALSRIEAGRLLAVEPDESARPYLEHLGATVTTLDRVEPGCVDAMICSHNLEHYPPQHLHAVLAAMRRALSPDGLLLVEVPRADLLNASNTEPRRHVPHLSFFTAAALTSLLERTGYRIVQEPHPERGPVVAVAARTVSARVMLLSARRQVGRITARGRG